MSMTTTPPSFVNNVINAEDLARVPGADWVVATGMVSATNPQGHLYLIRITDHRVVTAYPASDANRLNEVVFGEMSPPDPALFAPHGLSIRPGANGVHTLYVVAHGDREAVEVFEVDARSDVPTIVWVGAVLAPAGALLNDVAPHPEGGFIVSNFADGGAANYVKVFRRENSGWVLRWSQGGSGMTKIDGSDCISPNGVEISSDSRYLYINSWGVSEVLRIDLSTGERMSSRVDFLPDDFTWSEDGTHLFTTGQVGTPEDVLEQYAAKDKASFPVVVSRIDACTLEAETVATYDGRPDGWGNASAALQVGSEIWVGSARNTSIAIFELAG